MSQDRPSINDILLTVQKFLDDTGPKLEGEAKYHAQVSSYLLGICERELRLAGDFDRKEAVQLADFLGSGAPLDAMTAEFCANIRAGKYDKNWDQTLELILAQTIDKVKVVKPGHLALMHRNAH
ncbi:MAG: hypothetical protein JWM91_3658 [Rhodospirillales bacterium]|nr:hypothetical protein [Rhodospirillales bacterium]